MVNERVPEGIIFCRRRYLVGEEGIKKKKKKEK